MLAFCNWHSLSPGVNDAARQEDPTLVKPNECNHSTSLGLLGSGPRWWLTQVCDLGDSNLREKKNYEDTSARALLDLSEGTSILSDNITLAMLQARNALSIPCIAGMCLISSSRWILPGLFQAIFHLPSTWLQCIITISSIIALIVFLQVNGEAVC